ncbi:MAG: hypothetical protein LQ338_006391 [Usnochroma carphineum]|nr:MAG: hypothetical protein LQ338_006391 [Usnochroma carphineum]
MQLAHQARTKKKISKESLFARFNFRTEASPRADIVAPNSSSAAASPNPVSDAEARPNDESPPTSPITHGDECVDKAQHDQIQNMSIESYQSNNSVPVKEDKRNHDLPDVPQNPVEEEVTAKKRINVRSLQSIPRPKAGEESESDLEVLPVDKTIRKLDVFERIPAAKVSEERSLQKLRALAHLTSPNKHFAGKKSNMSLAEMQASLQTRARQQAGRERAEKIQELKDRGVIIQTAEERQKDQAEVEDLLEKARREAVELKQKEKDATRKEVKANGTALAADDSSDDNDGDYQDNDADESVIELSESEEEGENQSSAGEEGDEEEDDQDVDKNGASDQEGGLIENEASEVSDEDEKAHASDGEDQEPDADDAPVHSNRVRRRKNNVIEDDEDDELPEGSNNKANTTQAGSHPLLNLGLPTFAGPPMGMTQAFAATMADSQIQDNDHNGIATQEEDSLAFLGAPPEPELPLFDMDDSPQMVMDSQNGNNLEDQSQTEIVLDFTQSQVQDPNSNNMKTGTLATQLSQIPDPTQDVGFALTSPVAGRYDSMPPSTVHTVILPQPDKPASPVAKRKGRLMRKMAAALENESNAGMENDNHSMVPASAFEVLKKGSKESAKAVSTFDKKKSNAQEMVEEQAQESEDEYAGLGGASDDESGGEEDEEVRKMIEQGEVDVDERQLAAFYANKERVSDEKAVEKLFKDINNGMLRRKRGADFDLSDSEDDAEARRRRKQREFAKMRKALLENDNVGKIAEDPKKMAFLRAIEDREDDEDLDFLDQPQELSQPVTNGDSQETPDSQLQASPDKAATALGKRKRPLAESGPDAVNRVPVAARRTPAISKPQSLAEIRASVSFLIEEPDALPVAPSSSPAASDDEHENDEDGNTDISLSTNVAINNANKPFDSRRRIIAPVIDRLSLKRTSTSSTSTTSSNLFFHALTSTTDTSGFKVPSLLRRATSSSSTFNVSTKQDANGISHLAETERAAGGGEKGDFVRKGAGGKRSSVNWVRRERRGPQEANQGVKRKLGREGSSLTPNPHRFSALKNAKPPEISGAQQLSTPQTKSSKQFASTPRFSFSSATQPSQFSSPLIPRRRPPSLSAPKSAPYGDDIEETHSNPEHHDPQPPTQSRTNPSETIEDAPSPSPPSPSHKRRRIQPPGEDAISISSSPSPPPISTPPREQQSQHSSPPPPPATIPQQQHPTRFILSPKPDHSSSSPAIPTHRPPPFTLPPRETSPPPSSAMLTHPLFSPQRKGGGPRFASGGLASCVRDWVVDVATTGATSGRGEEWDRRVKVGAVRGGGRVMLVEDEQNGEGGMWMLVGRGQEVRSGGVVGVRGPVWDVEVLGRRWRVGVEWGFIDGV